jgi:23S rRNA (cytosine1962-C5)-methyltransferase
MKNSYRLCYSEADGLPGLIVDYYAVTGNRSVLSAQILTAGMDQLFSNLKEALFQLVDRETTAIVIRNDSSIRRYEGLPVEPAQVLSCPEGLDLKNAEAMTGVVLKTDFLHGQKTGLFLDQSFNIRVLSEILARGSASHYRILDLCCYVGQWSAQLSQFLISKGCEVEVTLFDASEKSLRFAEENVKRTGVKSVKTIRGDVLRDLKSLPSQGFDIVISDPPAFVKNKKEIEQGKHGYMKLNAEAFRLVSKDGFVVSCSCSGILNEDDFDEILKKSVKRSGRDMLKLARGGHAPDHPILETFPEGKYLKMVLHRALS